jgi:hypothetical protein
VDRVEGSTIEGRTIWQAHEIDGITGLPGRGTRNAGRVSAGDIVDVRIDAVVDDLDLAATIVSEPAPRDPRPASRRHLPLASVGSYGR